MSPRQERLLREVLPGVSLDLSGPPPISKAELASLFVGVSPRPADVWLEIGFGGGEHLLWQAAAHPDVGFIGCEPFCDGVVKVLSALEEGRAANVLIYPDDARDVLRWLPPRSLGRVFILFPDPWPKKRHHKRRLVAQPTLDLLQRVMRPGAELRVATDVGDQACAILSAIRAHPAFAWEVEGPEDWRRRKSDWPATRYEGKATRDGRRCYFFTFRLTSTGAESATTPLHRAS